MTTNPPNMFQNATTGSVVPKIPWLTMFSLLGIIVFQEIPYIPKRLGGNPTVLPFVALFFVSLRWVNIRIPRKRFLLLVGILGYFLVQAVYRFLGISSSGLGRYTNTIVFFTVFAAMPLLRFMSERQKCWIFFTTLGTMVLTIVNNIVMFRRYGFAFYEHILEMESVLTNAVNTQFTTATMLLAGTTFIALLHDHKRRLWWAGLFLLLNYFNNAVVQRTIAVLLSLVIYTLVIIYHRRRAFWANFLIVMGAIAVGLALENFELLLDVAQRFIPSDRIVARLQQISNMLASGDIWAAGGSMTGRYRLSMQSLETWTSSFSAFFLGVGDHWDNNLLIGNHCQWFDLLAQYGIVVAGVVFGCILSMLKMLMGMLPIPSGTPLRRQVCVLCVIFVVRGFLGAVLFGTIGIQMFIILPLVVSYLEKRKEVS